MRKSSARIHNKFANKRKLTSKKFKIPTSKINKMRRVNRKRKCMTKMTKTTEERSNSLENNNVLTNYSVQMGNNNESETPPRRRTFFQPKRQKQPKRINVYTENKESDQTSGSSSNKSDDATQKTEYHSAKSSQVTSTESINQLTKAKNFSGSKLQKTSKFSSKLTYPRRASSSSSVRLPISKGTSIKNFSSKRSSSVQNKIRDKKNRFNGNRENLQKNLIQSQSPETLKVPMPDIFETFYKTEDDDEQSQQQYFDEISRASKSRREDSSSKAEHFSGINKKRSIISTVVSKTPSLITPVNSSLPNKNDSILKKSKFPHRFTPSDSVKKKIHENIPDDISDREQPISSFDENGPLIDTNSQLLDISDSRQQPGKSSKTGQKCVKRPFCGTNLKAQSEQKQGLYGLMKGSFSFDTSKKKSFQLELNHSIEPELKSEHSAGSPQNSLPASTEIKPVNADNETETKRKKDSDYLEYNNHPFFTKSPTKTKFNMRTRLSQSRIVERIKQQTTNSELKSHLAQNSKIKSTVDAKSDLNELFDEIDNPKKFDKFIKGTDEFHDVNSENKSNESHNSRKSIHSIPKCQIELSKQKFLQMSQQKRIVDRDRLHNLKGSKKHPIAEMERKLGGRLDGITLFKNRDNAYLGCKRSMENDDIINDKKIDSLIKPMKNAPFMPVPDCPKVLSKRKIFNLSSTKKLWNRGSRQASPGILKQSIHNKSIKSQQNANYIVHGLLGTADNEVGRGKNEAHHANMQKNSVDSNYGKDLVLISNADTSVDSQRQSLISDFRRPLSSERKKCVNGDEFDSDFVRRKRQTKVKLNKDLYSTDSSMRKSLMQSAYGEQQTTNSGYDVKKLAMLRSKNTDKGNFKHIPSEDDHESTDKDPLAAKSSGHKPLVMTKNDDIPSHQKKTHVNSVDEKPKTKPLDIQDLSNQSKIVNKNKREKYRDYFAAKSEDPQKSSKQTHDDMNSYECNENSENIPSSYSKFLKENPDSFEGESHITSLMKQNDVSVIGVKTSLDNDKKMRKLKKKSKESENSVPGNFELKKDKTFSLDQTDVERPELNSFLTPKEKTSLKLTDKNRENSDSSKKQKQGIRSDSSAVKKEQILSEVNENQDPKSQLEEVKDLAVDKNEMLPILEDRTAESEEETNLSGNLIMPQKDPNSFEKRNNRLESEIRQIFGERKEPIPVAKVNFQSKPPVNLSQMEFGNERKLIHGEPMLNLEEDLKVFYPEDSTIHDLPTPKSEMDSRVFGSLAILPHDFKMSYGVQRTLNYKAESEPEKSLPEQMEDEHSLEMKNNTDDQEKISEKVKEHPKSAKIDVAFENNIKSDETIQESKELSRPDIPENPKRGKGIRIHNENLLLKAKVILEQYQIPNTLEFLEYGSPLEQILANSGNQDPNLESSIQTLREMYLDRLPDPRFDNVLAPDILSHNSTSEDTPKNPDSGIRKSSQKKVKHDDKIDKQNPNKNVLPITKQPARKLSKEENISSLSIPDKHEDIPTPVYCKNKETCRVPKVHKDSKNVPQQESQLLGSPLLSDNTSDFTPKDPHMANTLIHSNKPQLTVDEQFGHIVVAPIEAPILTPNRDSSLESSQIDAPMCIKAMQRDMKTPDYELKRKQSCKQREGMGPHSVSPTKTCRLLSNAETQSDLTFLKQNQRDELLRSSHANRQHYFNNERDMQPDHVNRIDALATMPSFKLDFNILTSPNDRAYEEEVDGEICKVLGRSKWKNSGKESKCLCSSSPCKNIEQKADKEPHLANKSPAEKKIKSKNNGINFQLRITTKGGIDISPQWTGESNMQPPYIETRHAPLNEMKSPSATDTVDQTFESDNDPSLHSLSREEVLEEELKFQEFIQPSVVSEDAAKETDDTSVYHDADPPKGEEEEEGENHEWKNLYEDPQASLDEDTDNDFAEVASSPRLAPQYHINVGRIKESTAVNRNGRNGGQMLKQIH